MQNACYISSMRFSRLRILVILWLISTGSLCAQDTGEEVVFGHLNVDSLRNAWHAVLADDGGERILCSWSERSATGTRILSTMLRPYQRAEFVLETVAGTDSCEDVRPAAAFLQDGAALVAWQQGCGGKNAVRGRLLDPAGHPAGPVFTINEGNYNAMMPAAGRMGGGAVLVAWQDYRNGALDCYVQRFDASGRPQGKNVLLNDDASRALQGPPRVAADNASVALVIWPDNRGDGLWKFYAARTDGTRPATNLLVDSAQRKAMTTLAAALALPPDSALLAWKDYREGHSNIYLRSADLRTGSFSPARRLNDDSTDRWQRLVVLDSDGGENIVACWEDYRNTENNQLADIYMQRLRRDGTAVGGNEKVNTRDDRIPRKMPKLAMLDNGQLLALWHQGDEGRYELHGQWYAPDGSRAGPSFCITCME
jgi:hypothetical protein